MDPDFNGEQRVKAAVSTAPGSTLLDLPLGGGASVPASHPANGAANPAGAMFEHPFQSGQARLEVARVSGESVCTRSWAVSPLKLLIPRPRGSSVWAYTSSYGGGLVAGDQTALDVRIAGGARCFLSTQASTKVYRNPLGKPCAHRTRAVIQAGALLVFAPDPVQCFAEAVYEQRQDFHLEPDAGLVLVDWLGAGRTARGERWAFTRFQSRNDVWLGPDRLLADALRLDAEDGPLDDAFRMGRFNCLALVVLAGESLREPSGELLERLAARPVPRRADLVCSASPLPHGAVLRVAGTGVEAVGREISEHLRFVRDWLLDDPWLRKW